MLGSHNVVLFVMRRTRFSSRRRPSKPVFASVTCIDVCVNVCDDDGRSMVNAAVRWALDALRDGKRTNMFAKISGEFEEETGSKVVMTAAAAAAPPLIFGENYLGLDDLQPSDAVEAAGIAASCAHHAVACHFISNCFEIGGDDGKFPFVRVAGIYAMKFSGKLRSDGGSACRMVIVHLMCCGCIMSASSMVTNPSVIALMARWGFLRWLADIAHVCVQCLLVAEDALKKFAPPPSRSSVSSFLQAPSSPSSNVSSLVEHMRGRLRVVFDYLQAEGPLLHRRPELALQQLQFSSAALAHISSAHSATAKIIHDEVRAELEAGEQRLSRCVGSQELLSGKSPIPSSPISAPDGSSSSIQVSANLSAASLSAKADAAPPLLLLRSYSRPQSRRMRYLPCSSVFVLRC